MGGSRAVFHLVEELSRITVLAHKRAGGLNPELAAGVSREREPLRSRVVLDLLGAHRAEQLEQRRARARPRRLGGLVRGEQTIDVLAVAERRPLESCVLALGAQPRLYRWRALAVRAAGLPFGVDEHGLIRTIGCDLAREAARAE